MTREELLKICEDAVVKCELWHDRDSCVTQYRLNTIYSFLKVGAEFTTEVDKNQTIWVTVKTTDEIIKLFEKELGLPIDTIDDYRTIVDPEYSTEMFSKDSPDDYDDEYRTYLPTREKLTAVEGKDWY